MSENGIHEAEQRVREMNRMTQQYSEQGNRYLQSMRNMQNVRQTRFEPAGQYSQQKNGQDNNFSGNRIGYNSQQNQQQMQNRQQMQFRHNQQPSQQRQAQQNRQQNFRNLTNNCPPPGDPEGERRNMPEMRQVIHSCPENQNHFSGFPDLLADNEKLMILLLIYLLMKEKADIKLILALGYLLL